MQKPAKCRNEHDCQYCPDYQVFVHVVSLLYPRHLDSIHDFSAVPDEQADQDQCNDDE